MINLRNFIPVALVSVSFTACMPSHLAKYRKESADKQDRSEQTDQGDMMQPTSADIASPPSSMRDKSRDANTAGSRDATGKEAQQRASIYAIDKQTYRLTLKENEVWDSVLNVLLRNYNLTIVDKASGIVTTEWDTFYLNNGVYRNKVSVRVFKSSWNTVDVTVHNNVERLRDASQAAGTVGAVWLPSDDPANEVARVIQNMALVLNQPPPVLPPNAAVAKGTLAPETTGTR